MQECIHGLEAGCTYCSGKDTTRQADPKPITWDSGEPVLVDSPETRIADLVAVGKMCSLCLTLHAPIGCECQRRERYDDVCVGLVKTADGDDPAMPQGWLAEQLANTDPATRLHPKVLAGLALSTTRRAALRAGVAPDDYADDRLKLMEAYDVKPQYRKFNRQEATHLPV